MSKLLGWILCAIAAVIISILFGTLIVTFIGVLLAAFIVAWLCGVKITINHNGVPIGYIRWFKFHDYSIKPWRRA